MLALSPTYTLTVTVHDRLSSQITVMQSGIASASSVPVVRKFYKDETTGCDRVLSVVQKALADAGVDADVTLSRFEWQA